MQSKLVVTGANMESESKQKGSPVIVKPIHSYHFVSNQKYERDNSSNQDPVGIQSNVWFCRSSILLLLFFFSYHVLLVFYSSIFVFVDSNANTHCRVTGNVSPNFNLAVFIFAMVYFRDFIVFVVVIFRLRCSNSTISVMEQITTEERVLLLCVTTENGLLKSVFFFGKVVHRRFYEARNIKKPRMISKSYKTKELSLTQN